MSENTLAENLQIIRTNVYGKNVRAAIADAIEQSDAEIDGRIDQIHDDIVARDLFVTLTPMENTISDYRMVISNAQQQL